MSNISKGAQWSMVSGAFLMGMVACSPLEPILDPETSDLQLTVDTLRSSLRDAQRTIAELHMQIDRQRQSYADAQILRAQFEGSSREAERRLIEARRVIDLQREELAMARSEREQMRRTGTALQRELRQSRKQLSKTGKQTKGGVSPAAIMSRRADRLDLTNVALEQEAQSDNLDESADTMSSAGVVPPVMRPSIMTGYASVSIKPGDTLWSLARRYQTSVTRLMAVNDLINDRIHVGQALRVPTLSPDAIGYDAM
ncbi:MAG: LysM peptidoglycan-binding domain-containing protein [Nitrospira sp.]|nr:LysM peptidoglycan-binding domain-containing protein [Nitrospira sp.]